MKQELDHDIRYSYFSDEKYLLSWLSKKNALKWLIVQKKDEIQSFVRNWIGFSKFQASLTATIDNIPCGIGTLFLMPYKKIAHLCFFNLIVDEKYQRQGIGKSLIKNLIHLSKDYFRHEQIYAELVSGCPLEKVLLNFNFKEFARQEGYIL